MKGFAAGVLTRLDLRIKYYKREASELALQAPGFKSLRARSGAQQLEEFAHDGSVCLSWVNCALWWCWHGGVNEVCFWEDLL